MPPSSARPVLTRRHRGHRFDVYDRDGDGWVVVILGVAEQGETSRDELRTSAPNGMGVLLDEARQRVDRRLDNSAGELGHW